MTTHQTDNNTLGADPRAEEAAQLLAEAGRLAGRASALLAELAGEGHDAGDVLHRVTALRLTDRGKVSA